MNKKIYNILITIFVSFIVCYVFGFILSSIINNEYKLIIQARYLTDGLTMLLTLFFLVVEGLIIGLYYYKHYWLLNSKNIIKGKDKDLHLSSNLEQSRFQSDKEVEKNFKVINFKDLSDTEIVGSIIKAEEKQGELKVTFAKPAHTLVIGTTGSGKTTTYVNPMIQILAETKTKPSMFISDPKGELYSLHAKNLEEKGYKVKVLDLRNPYNSVRWNPLERAYTYYQRSLHLEDEVIADDEHGGYIFEGKLYHEPTKLQAAIQVKKQQLYDVVFEDLHDITTVLCPINNKNEPMWESGAQNFVLAIALAMLEDSEDPRLNLTKEKFNFYSITKVATRTDNECEYLFKYFQNRSPLSKAVSLSKQVLDASDKTRGSYLSSTFDKISMFSDLSLCALTSENEIEFASMGEVPIALFLQIPDEKETRHTLASMVILQAYKELVYKANMYPNQSLPKPVYFILDEFGNLPKVHKLEQMITVGRSRNIWMNLVVQSYAQLSKVYEDKSADIIKSNCNIQVFIGTTDYKTIEEFSKRCGNFSMMQRSVGFNSSKGEDINSNTTVRERPLIYPSELQMLNSNGNMGHAIVTVFGYHPIKSIFTPSYESSYYQLKIVNQELRIGRFFDEEKAFYDMTKRSQLFEPKRTIHKETGVSVTVAENVQNTVKTKVPRKVLVEQLQELIRINNYLFSDHYGRKIREFIKENKFEDLLRTIRTLIGDARKVGDKEKSEDLMSIEKRIQTIINKENEKGG